MAKFSKSFKFEMKKALANGEVASRKEFVASRAKRSQKKAKGRIR